MKLFLVAAAATSIGASLPLTVLAQDGSVARLGIYDQLKLLDVRVDRDLAQGRLSPAEADRAHRDINRIENEARSDSVRNDGHLTDADATDLKARIDRLRRSVRWERTSEIDASPVWLLDRREQWVDDRIQHASIDGHLSGNEGQRG